MENKIKNNLKPVLKKDNFSEFKKLLEENLVLNRAIYESSKKTEKYIHFVKILNIIKFILIFLPIILGILYLIPFLGEFIDMYKGFFNDVSGQAGILENIKEVQNLTN